MSAENLSGLLQAVWEEQVKKAPRRHPLRTPECPPLPRFLEAQRSGWSREQAAHAGDCPYCQKITEMVWRDEYPNVVSPAQWPAARRLVLAPHALAALGTEEEVAQAEAQPQQVLTSGSPDTWLSVSITREPRGEVHIRFATHREELANARVRLTLFSPASKQIKEQVEFTLAEVATAQDEPKRWQWTWICPLSYLREPLGMAIEVEKFEGKR